MWSALGLPAAAAREVQPLHLPQSHCTNSATGTPERWSSPEATADPRSAAAARRRSTPTGRTWGPRLGINYSVNDKTVFRAADRHRLLAGRRYRRRTRQRQRRLQRRRSGPRLQHHRRLAQRHHLRVQRAGPSFWLNSNAGYLGANANTSLFGPGYAYPAAPAFGAASTILDAGNYLNSTGAFVTASSMGYDDPYFAGRAPMYTFWNAGFERTITRDMTLQVNYVGRRVPSRLRRQLKERTRLLEQSAQSHLPCCSRRRERQELRWRTVPLLTAPATTANVAILNAAHSRLPKPGSFIAAANAFPTQQRHRSRRCWRPSPSTAACRTAGRSVYGQLLLQRPPDHAEPAHGARPHLQRQLHLLEEHRRRWHLPQRLPHPGGRHRRRRPRLEPEPHRPLLDHGLHAGDYQRLRRLQAAVRRQRAVGAATRCGRELLGGWQLSWIYTYSAGTPVGVTWRPAATAPTLLPTPASACRRSIRPLPGPPAKTAAMAADRTDSAPAISALVPAARRSAMSIRQPSSSRPISQLRSTPPPTPTSRTSI